MSLSFFQVLKGLLVQNEIDRSKQLALEVSSSATTGTLTTIQAAQTANRTISLPDASGQLMTPSSTDALSNKTIDGDLNTLLDIPLSAIKTDGGDANTFVVRDGAGALDSVTYTQATALINPMVGDSGSGGTKGLVPAPAIGDATKFLRGDGTFQTIAGSGDVVGPASSTDNAITRFDGVTGKLLQNSVITVSDLGVVAGASLNNSNSVTVLDSNLTIQDNLDNTKQVQIQASSVTTGTTATLTVPSASTTLVGTTSTQALTNKDIDGGTASNSNRITLPQNTTVALAALTRKEGTVAYDTTLNEVVYDDGSNFQPISAGATPTGDADTLAFFDSLGNLSSDDTDLRFYNFTGPLNPSGIVCGDITVDVTVDVLGHSLIIASAEDIGTEIYADTQSLAIGLVNTGGKLEAQTQSISHGNISGASSIIQSTAGSHAHGNVSGPQGIIIADNHSHAFGNVSSTLDARIQAFGQCLAFGNVTTDFNITAQSASIAGGQTGAGGVYAGIASISFGEDINEGVIITPQFTYQFGLGHSSEAPHVAKFGRFSEDVPGDGSTWVTTDPLFVLGNGANVGSPANAYRVDKDGREIATASQVKTAIRTIAAASAIDERTDYKIICDTTGASGNLTLPPGEDGLEYVFTGAGAGGASYTLVPDGIETLDASVISSIATTVVSRIYFFSGVWYGM